MTSCKDDSVDIKPEITKDWFYQAGQSFEYSETSSTYNLTEPTRSEDMTWDFYDVQGTPQGDLSIVNSSGITGAEFFPEANLALRDADSDQIIFYKKDNDTLFQLGVYVNATFHYKYTDPLIVSI